MGATETTIDQYLPVISKTSSLLKTGRYQPYKVNQPHKNLKMSEDGLMYCQNDLTRKDVKPSMPLMNKFLLGTLSDFSNPVTHSDVGQRSGTYCYHDELC